MAFVGVYRALYDYAPQSDEELEIKDGDLLFVLDKSSEDDWWRCKKKAASDDDDEPEGLVPNNYVEQVRPTHSARALYDYTKQTDEELSFQENTSLDVYDETDPDWTLVGSGGEYGFAPAIYIEPLSAGAGAGAAAPAPVASASPPAMPPRPSATDDGPLPGEADYPRPSSSGTNPAAAIAGIIANRTGGASDPAPAARRTLASPPPMAPRSQYTPEQSEEEEQQQEEETEEEEEEAPPPPKPQRPQSHLASPPSAPSPIRSPARSESQYIPSGTAEAPGIFPSPPHSASRGTTFDDYDRPQNSPSGYHLYNVHEMITHMGKSKKLPMTLGINILKGIIMIAPEKSRDGPSKEWTAEKLSHYSIEGKHVFVELLRPSRSVDFHAGAKDTAQEIVAHLGELAGASRMEGLREVWAASAGTAAPGMRKGKMLYEFMAQGEDEVSVAVDDEVIIIDDTKSEEWWMVRRLKNGKEGVVPSSYVEITGTVPAGSESVSGLNAARSTVEQNRIEEERLAKEATKNGTSSHQKIPDRGSSLSGESSSRSKSKRGSASGASKSKPNTSRVRTWTDRSGTFKVEAEFIGLREGKIHLHKLNGVKIAVPVAKMSVEDLEYVERATGASLDEDKPLSDIKRRSTQKASKTNGAGAQIVPKDHEYWFDFFLQCGVNPQICDRYAQAFSRDQMGPEVLPEVNEQLLRTLGLKEGDILRVMKTLDNKYSRSRTVIGGAGAGASGADDDKIEQANGGGLFSGPGGALKNNTRKGRPAPAVQTNDMVSEDAFKSEESASPAARSPGEGAQKTILASAPAREPKTGFEDDAWDVKPARTATPEVQREAPKPAEPPRPKVNDDLASLSITSPPLQPTPTAAPAPPVIQPPPPATEPQQPQGADQAIFDKIASLAPARQRPQPPPTQQPGGSLGVPPPPRASSAPGFQPQQNSFGNVAPIQAQLTGYQQQPQQQQQFMQPQQTSFQGYAGGFQGQQQQQQPPNGFAPQATGVQAMQHNYPALQPQPTGMNFQPQSQFGQQSQAQHYGMPPPQQQPQQNYQQQLLNGAQTGSPFADPPRQPYQPSAPSGLQNAYQPTGFQQPQQTAYNMGAQQPTGAPNGTFGQPPPQLPPQQTGGVFEPSQPLVPQKTGPAPPVRFGVKPGEKKLVAQPTGRANLAKASKYFPSLLFSTFGTAGSGVIWGCMC